jgi:DNA polymerase III subunit gamma/tau
LLYTRLKQDVHLVDFEPGKIILRLGTSLPRDFAGRVSECLTGWTGQPWKVMLSDETGEPSLSEQERTRKEQQMQETAAHPLVSSVLEQFPGAKVVGVKTNT